MININPNRKQLIFYILALIFLIISVLIITGILPLSTLKENIRYFYSAAAQSFAALVALVLVVFNITASRIPNYESIFGELYPRILKKYYEVKKTKNLIILSGAVILIFLISLILIVENLILIYILLMLGLVILVYSLIEFIFFFSDSLLKSGKNKFFNDCAHLIMNKFNHFELFDIFSKIMSFRNNLESPRYKDILIDNESISGLLRPIVFAYGKFLLDKDRMGENAYYGYFNQILDYVLKRGNAEIIYQSIYYKISPKFRRHVRMCIEDGHCIKYVPDAIGLVTKMIDGFNKTWNGNMRDEYLRLFKDIAIEIKDLKDYHWYLNTGLSDLARSFAISGLPNYDLLLRLLGELNIPLKEKVMYLESMLETNETHYGRARTDEELENIGRHNGIEHIYGIDGLKSRMHFIKMLKGNIRELKRNNKIIKIKSSSN